MAYIFRTSHPGDLTKMIVRNLAFWGCKFETVRACSLVPGEDITLEFVLDNHDRSKIKRKAVVVDVKGSDVRCKFSIPPDFIDSELGYYLKNR